MIVGGVLDPHIWKLTREAATDEDLIKDLKQKLDKNNRNFEEISKQNLDFKNQIMYASNHIKMISDSTKLVI
jgi:predicted  nucleic acid-binding Zn-ribbon protein